jgi:aquaporin Z
MRDSHILTRLFAEFAGTFFLVLTVGISASSGNKMAPIAIGLMLAVQVYIFSSVSGGFFNPSVTLAVLLSFRDKISWRHAVFYVVAQILGGIAGGVVAYKATGVTFFFDYALLGRSWDVSFMLEMFFTMCLCLIVLVTTSSNDSSIEYFGFSIGCAVVTGGIACGGIDQGSFNPAVTVGTNVVNLINFKENDGPSSGAWVVFTLAPLVGGLLAALVFRLTHNDEHDNNEVVKTTPSSQEVEIVGVHLVNHNIPNTNL